MKKLLATAALLLTATTASAQELCMSEADMTAAMAQAGFVPFVGGLVDEQGAALWFYINPTNGAWMIHSVDLNADEECHIMGGGEYFIPGSPV